MSNCPYTNPLFTQHMNLPIKTIVELGCNYYTYTYELLDVYTPEVLYAFEASPKCFDYCMTNITNDKLKFIPRAVSLHDGVVNFYDFEIDVGCSSLFEREHLKEFQRPPVKISCTRLDSFFKDKPNTQIDLLCMDIQGSEMNAMIGLGDMLKSVRYIILEMPNSGMVVHKGSPTHEDYLSFFDREGFTIVEKVYENDFENNVFLKGKNA